MIEEKMHDDVISRQAVIELVKEFRENIDGDGIRNAYEEFMRDLEQLPSAHPTHSNTPNTLKTLDCIGRQEAIDALEREKTYSTAYKDGYTQTDYFKQYNMGLTDGIKAIKALPSAQPFHNITMNDVLKYIDNMPEDVWQEFTACLECRGWELQRRTAKWCGSEFA